MPPRFAPGPRARSARGDRRSDRTPAGRRASREAAALLGPGNCEAALAAYEVLLGRQLGYSTKWIGYGLTLAVGGGGHGADAADALRRSLLARLDFCEASLEPANLKTVAFTPAEARAMDALRRRRRLSDADRVYLDFALGKTAEDAGDTAAAFAAYARANALRRASLRYDPRRVTDHVARSRNLFTAAFFEARSGRPEGVPPSLGREVIFIVGLPRAGSTLVEILASRSQVETAGELPDIALLARRLGIEGAAGRGLPARQAIRKGWRASPLKT